MLSFGLFDFCFCGCFSSSGNKSSFFTFFAKDSGWQEAPLNMLITMALVSFLCLFMGCNPQWLYSLLPTEQDIIHTMLPILSPNLKYSYLQALFFFFDRGVDILRSSIHQPGYRLDIPKSGALVFRYERMVLEWIK